MRVLIVTPWFPSRAHSVSGLFNRRDAQLLTRDHDVRVLHLIRPDWFDDSDQSEEFDGISVTRVPFALQRPRTWKQALAAIKRGLRDADLLHTMALPALLPFALLAVRKPWVHTEHFSTLVTASSWASAAALSIVKRLLRRPNEVVAVGSTLAQVIDRVRSRPCTVIDNEVMAPVEAVRQRHDFSGRIRIISVGGLVERKGPLEAVDALAELSLSGLDVELRWVGEGPLREDVLKRASEHGLADRVSLFGLLAPASLSEELLGADLFLLPVETETFGVAIAEALTHGLPVVATGTGGHEEFLPKRASRLTERTPAAIAAAVQDLIGDHALWSPAEIVRYAGERFSARKRQADYAAVYSQAVAARA